MPQYQGVWTLQAQAQAQSNQQWVTDPQFKNTTLLLQADGTGSGSQNQTFLDGSTNNFFITRNGNTTQGTFTPFSQAPGYWGNYFNGSTDKLTMASNAGFAFGTGAYTVEFWVYFISIASTDSRIFDAGSASGSFGVSIDNTNAVNIAKYGTGYVVQSPARALPSNQWAHVAVVRDSTSTNATRIYINGSLVVTGTDNNNWTVTTTPSICGLDLSLYNPQCYLSNLRVVKGGSLYTSNFTPTAAPLSTTVSSGTVYLLTCQSNRFVDNSGTISSFTVTGTPSVQAFAPFAPQYQYDATVTGGSGYFDGTGDYLTGPSASGGDFSTGSFTISCWFYPTTLTGGTNYGLMSYADTGGWNGWQLQVRGSTKDILFEFLTGSAGASQITGGSIALNAWNFVSIVRSGSTVSMYVNSTTAATSTTNSTAYGAATSRVIVGSDRTLASSFIGYISNSKLVKQANAPASIPTAPDTATTNTSLLLNYTNAGIYDGKMANVLETVGNAQVATSPVKYGSGSMSFNGSSDYLYLPSNPALAMGTGNFTIECWAYFNQIKLCALIDIATSGTAARLAFVLYATGYLALDTNASPVTTPAGTIVAGQWYHLALVRTGTGTNQTTIYVNGVARGTGTVTNDFTFTTARVGNAFDNQYMNGYIDDMRVTKGVARYYANFTPPQQALPRQ